MFTDEILSPGSRSHAGHTPLSGSSGKLDMSAEEWDDVDPADALFGPIKVSMKGDVGLVSQLIGSFWKERTMQLDSDAVTFSKDTKKNSTVKLSLKLLDLGCQVHDGVLYLKQAGDEEIWRVKMTSESPTIKEWCTHICKASEALHVAANPAGAASEDVMRTSERELFVVPLPPSYTSSFKPRYEPTSKAGKLQQMCSLELTALVSSECREVEQKTAMVYANVTVEHTVQTGAPAGFWEGCDHVDHYTLGQPGSDKLKNLARHLVFVSMADCEMVCKIADLIVQHSKEHREANLEYTVACIPGTTVLVEQVFMERLHCVNDPDRLIDARLQSLHLTFVPIEEDVFSMEMGSTEGFNPAKKSQLRSTMAQGLCRLDVLFNGFGRVQAKGDFSVGVLSSLESLQAEMPKVPPSEDEESRRNRHKCRLLAIDRTVDVISVLCTQLSYGGLIEEVFGSLKAASDYVTSKDAEFKLPFTVGDPVWAALQDLSLDDARARLLEWQKELLAIEVLFLNPHHGGSLAIHITAQRVHDQVLTDFQSMRKNNASIDEMKKFVAEKLPKNQEENPLVHGHIQLLDRVNTRLFDEKLTEVRLLESKNMEYGMFGMNWYIEARDEIKDHLNQLIDRGSDPPADKVSTKARVLRLLCLATLTSGGLREEDFDEFRLALIQNFGISSMGLIQGLERAGLLSGSLSWKLRHGLMDTDWEKVRAQFDLVADPSEEAKFSRGYMVLMPLVARLIPLALNNQWDSNTLSRLPGDVIDRTRQPPGLLLPKVENADGPMFVLFSGGCTRAEISEVRAVAKQFNREMIVLTTGIISGDDFIYGFMDSEPDCQRSVPTDLFMTMMNDPFATTVSYTSSPGNPF